MPIDLSLTLSPNYLSTSSIHTLILKSDMFVSIFLMNTHNLRTVLFSHKKIQCWVLLLLLVFEQFSVVCSSVKEGCIVPSSSSSFILLHSIIPGYDGVPNLKNQQDMCVSSK